MPWRSWRRAERHSRSRPAGDWVSTQRTQRCGPGARADSSGYLKSLSPKPADRVALHRGVAVGLSRCTDSTERLATPGPMRPHCPAAMALISHIATAARCLCARGGAQVATGESVEALELSAVVQALRGRTAAQAVELGKARAEVARLARRAQQR
jgi:hypothetical protein